MVERTIPHNMVANKKRWWRKVTFRCVVCGCPGDNLTTDCCGRMLTAEELGHLDAGVMNFVAGRFCYG